jgi:amidohydrolase
MVALRGDMDALPIAERSTLDYCSTNPGVMHACGHDGHTTILLGTVRALARHRDRIKGTVRFLFQPSEENVRGAESLCAAGAMDEVDAVFGLHGWPVLPVGKIGILAGPMMAGVDDFDITIHGRGGHAGYPHIAVDPIVIGAQLVSALQGIISRETDPLDPAVISVTQFHAGATHNVIPELALLSGTIRTLSAGSRERLPRRVEEIAQAICAGAGAQCTVSIIKGSPPVVNDENATAMVGRVGVDMLGDESVVALKRPSMGAEDFAVYLGHSPGAFFRLGLGDVSGLHTPTFNFADSAIPVGVEMLSSIALEFLAHGF